LETGEKLAFPRKAVLEKDGFQKTDSEKVKFGDKKIEK